ncbi:MAG: hypothetical protein KJ927_13130 [Candidatus Eisenbacteria bacterium]|nr:hypothetical protein [Candidatus Eisenbacteria bacterium]MBU1949648.1 hypothetical protein [Candidatus Eisenbacteria bacterium]
MFNRIVFLLCCSLLILSPLVIPGAGAQPDPEAAGVIPKAAIHAAQQGLQRFLDLIPPGELGHFGFQDRGELSLAALGEPFMIYTLTADEILADAEDLSRMAGIHPTGVWQFPVVAAGSPRTLLTVDQMPDGWEAVDLGGLSPAPEMEVLVARWPASDGYQLRYLFIYQTGSQFVWVTGKGESQLVPLEATARSLGLLDEGSRFEYRPMPLSEAVAILAPYVRLALVRRQNEGEEGLK